MPPFGWAQRVAALIAAGIFDHAPGALVPVGTIGTTVSVSNNTRFVMEAGLGGIFARQYSASAGYIHLSFGVLFDVGKSRN